MAGRLAGTLADGDDQRGCLTNIVVEILGAFLSGALYQLITGRDWDFGFNLASFVVAVAGSVLLLPGVRFLQR